MACELRAYIAEPDGSIPVVHIFYGADEAECERLMEAHMAGCKNFAKADQEDRVLTEVETIDDEDVPTREDFEEAEDGEEEEESEDED